MGRKKIERPSTDQLFGQVMELLVPKEILKNFDLYGVKEKKDCWELELREKESQVPDLLKGEIDIVLDGYCNGIEALSHSFSGKPVLLIVYRRRWKKAGNNEHYSNSYDLTLKGLKLVPELGLFLKE